MKTFTADFISLRWQTKSWGGEMKRLCRLLSFERIKKKWHCVLCIRWHRPVFVYFHFYLFTFHSKAPNIFWATIAKAEDGKKGKKESTRARGTKWFSKRVIVCIYTQSMHLMCVCVCVFWVYFSIKFYFWITDVIVALMNQAQFYNILLKKFIQSITRIEWMILFQTCNCRKLFGVNI